MCTQPHKIEFALPGWIDLFMNAYLPSSNIQHRMHFVIEASRMNIGERTGGPFAAAVFEIDTGTLVSLGTNIVTGEGLSILHAEIVAISLAQRIVGSYDLGGAGLPEYELVTSTEPCAMCFGAIPWSGVRRVVIGARSADAQSIGFDEGPKPANWRAELEKRGIQTICDVDRDLAARVLVEYSQQNGKIYNARESVS